MKTTDRPLEKKKASALLKSGFQLPETRFWGGKAYLFEDCALFVGWRFFKRYQRTIGLDEVESVSWWTGGDSANLVLFLKGKEDFACQLKGAGLWKFEIDQLLARKGHRNTGLPDASLVRLNDAMAANTGDGQVGTTPTLSPEYGSKGPDVIPLDSHIEEAQGPLFVPREKLAELARIEWKDDQGLVTCRLIMKNGEIFVFDIKGDAVISVSEVKGSGYHINNILRLVPGQKSPKRVLDL